MLVPRKRLKAWAVQATGGSCGGAASVTKSVLVVEPPVACVAVASDGRAKSAGVVGRKPTGNKPTASASAVFAGKACFLARRFMAVEAVCGLAGVGMAGVCSARYGRDS